MGIDIITFHLSPLASLIFFFLTLRTIFVKLLDFFLGEVLLGVSTCSVLGCLITLWNKQIFVGNSSALSCELISCSSGLTRGIPVDSLQSDDDDLNSRTFPFCWISKKNGDRKGKTCLYSFDLYLLFRSVCCLWFCRQCDFHSLSMGSQYLF